MMETNYNISILIEVANDYFYAEQELKIFLKTWEPGWWEYKSAKEREEYTKYSERSKEKYNAVCLVCRLINIDTEKLFAMVKTLNRYEKSTNYKECIHINYFIEKNVRRFLTKNEDCHYKSTGRKRRVLQ